MGRSHQPFCLSLPIFSFRILMPPAAVPPDCTDSLDICGPKTEAAPCGALFVHHNLVAGEPIAGKLRRVTYICSALLNDLFGVQVRGGCMCAGPVVQAEMGISNSDADALEHVMLQASRISDSMRIHVFSFHCHAQGYELLRPGVVRLCLHYCSRCIDTMHRLSRLHIFSPMDLSQLFPPPLPICSDAVLRYLVDSVLFVAQVSAYPDVLVKSPHRSSP